MSAMQDYVNIVWLMLIILEVDVCKVCTADDFFLASFFLPVHHSRGRRSQSFYVALLFLPGLHATREQCHSQCRSLDKCVFSLTVCIYVLYGQYKTQVPKIKYLLTCRKSTVFCCIRKTFAIIKIVYLGKNTLLSILVLADARSQCRITAAVITVKLALWPGMPQHRLCCVFLTFLKVQQYYYLGEQFLGKPLANTSTLSSLSNSAFNAFHLLRSTLVLNYYMGVHMSRVVLVSSKMHLVQSDPTT